MPGACRTSNSVSLCRHTKRPGRSSTTSEEPHCGQEIAAELIVTLSPLVQTCPQSVHTSRNEDHDEGCYLKRPEIHRGSREFRPLQETLKTRSEPTYTLVESSSSEPFLVNHETGSLQCPTNERTCTNEGLGVCRDCYHRLVRPVGNCACSPGCRTGSKGRMPPVT